MFRPNLASAGWVKSSFSENGMNCVEIAHGPTWVKSSYSHEGTCVEVAHGPTWTAMRDSKYPDAPALVFDPFAMEQFLAGVRAGEFDR